jgi:hypothetical protein
MMDWHYELALQQTLERAEEAIAAYLMSRLDHLDTDTRVGEGMEASGLTPAQFSQLSAVAMESDAVPVVVNYLRYQIGRSKPREAWRWNGVGMAVVSVLENEMQELARQTANRAASRVAGRRDTATPLQLNRAWIAVVRRFLALLSRRFEQRYRDADR